MGLIIKGQINSIDLDGVQVELTEVYARLECALRPNGTTIECAFPYVFKTKQAFKNGAQSIAHNLAMTSATGECVEGEAQSIAAAHRIAKDELEKVGYEVVIDLA